MISHSLLRLDRTFLRHIFLYNCHEREFYQSNWAHIWRRWLETIILWIPKSKKKFWHNLSSGPRSKTIFSCGLNVTFRSSSKSKIYILGIFGTRIVLKWSNILNKSFATGKCLKYVENNFFWYFIDFGRIYQLIGVPDTLKNSFK